MRGSEEMFYLSTGVYIASVQRGGGEGGLPKPLGRASHTSSEVITRS